MNIDFLYGLLGLSFWGYVIATAISLQITIVCVTVYLHRDAAHRALDLHPAIRHFARFWIWFTAAMLLLSDRNRQINSLIPASLAQP